MIIIYREEEFVWVDIYIRNVEKMNDVLICCCYNFISRSMMHQKIKGKGKDCSKKKEKKIKKYVPSVRSPL